jgi:4-methyl-5(b-hydroxyethyl)-thiazole monophosphate biosynthesis
MKALVILADGFEETEAFTVIDVLRRAGVYVTTAGLNTTIVESMNKVRTMADKKLSDLNENGFDAIILPGGPGYRALMNSDAVLKLIKDFDKSNKLIAAICAAPAVLAKAGILEDKIATIYPGMESMLPKPRDAKVIVAGNVVTSRSPGTAMEFALKIAEIMVGKNAATKVREGLVID